MTGPDHYREAERLAAEGVVVVTAIRDALDDSRRDALGKKAMGIWAQAQVHATLALAAATALSRYSPETGLTDTDRRAWYFAASEGPGEKRRQREAEAAELAEFATEAQS